MGSHLNVLHCDLNPSHSANGVVADQSILELYFGGDLSERENHEIRIPEHGSSLRWSDVHSLW